MSCVISSTVIPNKKLSFELGPTDSDTEFTEYLPDYPADGHGITVRRLVDHTSGIKGYTEMPSFGAIATRDLPRVMVETCWAIRAMAN
jgi:CubicO group peptidase (beta-lactamase class C family)